MQRPKSDPVDGATEDPASAGPMGRHGTTGLSPSPGWRWEEPGRGAGCQWKCPSGDGARVGGEWVRGQGGHSRSRPSTLAHPPQQSAHSKHGRQQPTRHSSYPSAGPATETRHQTTREACDTPVAAAIFLAELHHEGSDFLNGCIHNKDHHAPSRHHSLAQTQWKPEPFRRIKTDSIDDGSIHDASFIPAYPPRTRRRGSIPITPDTHPNTPTGSLPGFASRRQRH
jgi:hypothetical protein